MPRRDLYVGDPVPWFDCASSNNPLFHFETIAGRYVVLTFVPSAADSQGAAVVSLFTQELRDHFDDVRLSYFTVTNDPADEAENRLVNMTPGIRHFWDFDKNVTKLFGVIGDPGDEEYRGLTVVLDPFLRVFANIRHMPDGSHLDLLRRVITRLPAVDDYAGVPISAPVLILPRIFEPQFCRDMIDLYNKQGGTESGFMREKDGKTIAMLDSGFKRRKDFTFDDGQEFEALRQQIRVRFKRRLIPEIQKAFQFHVTRIERYIVACYESESLGFFRAHRDNTTKGTAHRRFACSINLNAEEYDGGDLRFPEFGTKTYRAPSGGAVVFSCSLLHEATPVTRGQRYAFLPFFYDDAANAVRQQNRQFLSREVVNLNALPQE